MSVSNRRRSVSLGVFGLVLLGACSSTPSATSTNGSSGVAGTASRSGDGGTPVVDPNAKPDVAALGLKTAGKLTVCAGGATGSGYLDEPLDPMDSRPKEGLKGLNVDLLTAMTQKLGISIEWEPKQSIDASRNLIPGLENNVAVVGSGECDTSTAPVSADEAKASGGLATESYLDQQFAALVPASQAAATKSVADIEARRISWVNPVGVSATEAMRKAFPSSEPYFISQVLQAQSRLMVGSSGASGMALDPDAVLVLDVVDATPTRAAWALPVGTAGKSLKDFTGEDLVVAFTVPSGVALSYPVKKGNDELAAALNWALGQIKSDGSYDTIVTRWTTGEGMSGAISTGAPGAS